MNTWVPNDIKITQLIILKTPNTKKVRKNHAFFIHTVLQGNKIVEGRFLLWHYSTLINEERMPQLDCHHFAIPSEIRDQGNDHL